MATPFDTIPTGVIFLQRFKALYQQITSGDLGKWWRITPNEFEGIDGPTFRNRASVSLRRKGYVITTRLDQEGNVWIKLEGRRP